MKKIFILTVLILFGCGQKKKVPEDVLSIETMIVVEMDFQLLEAQLKSISIPVDSAELLYSTFSEEIYEKHGVEKAQYEKSYTYYMEDIEGMDKIYAAIIDSLSLRQSLRE
jgi:hypothetical protein